MSVRFRPKADIQLLGKKWSVPDYAIHNFCFAAYIQQLTIKPGNTDDRENYSEFLSLLYLNY